MLRHERMAVAMAVAEATHHSSRGQKDCHSHQGGAEHDPYCATGTKASTSVDAVGHSLRHSSGDGLPTLALPSLAGSAGEAVDGAALSFLTAQALEPKRKAQRMAAKRQQAGPGAPVDEWLPRAAPCRGTRRTSGTLAPVKYAGRCRLMLLLQRGRRRRRGGEERGHGGGGGRGQDLGSCSAAHDVSMILCVRPWKSGDYSASSLCLTALCPVSVCRSWTLLVSIWYVLMCQSTRSSNFTSFYVEVDLGSWDDSRP